jgi:hypothetical protein
MSRQHVVGFHQPRSCFADRAELVLLVLWWLSLMLFVTETQWCWFATRNQLLRCSSEQSMCRHHDPLRRSIPAQFPVSGTSQPAASGTTPIGHMFECYMVSYMTLRFKTVC